MKTEHATELAAKQGELDTANTRIETLETSESTLSDEIKDLKAEVEANQPFVAIGKTAIEGVRANIRTVSAQVEGTDFDAPITDTQIAAFGNDHVALAKLETKVKAQRDKMFKSGDLKPDENTSNDDTSSEQDQFALGQSIGKAHGGNVVQMRQ